ncbi:MAG: hypothetical protein QF738_00055, partial [Rhodospirillales bacterium]|nr:hypothetical protein [Rhodospirillales bacterium]
HLGFAQHADNLFWGVAFTAHFVLLSRGQNAPNSLNKSGPLLGGHSREHPDGHEALQTNREANRLPNGNTLVSSQDRLYEVTRGGKIVWQLNAPPQGDNRRKFHKAIRIAPDGKTFGG